MKLYDNLTADISHFKMWFYNLDGRHFYFKMWFYNNLDS